MRFLPCSLSSFLVELSTLDDTLALFSTLQATPLMGVEEIIPAARTLLVHFDPALTQATTLFTAIRQCEGQPQAARESRVISIPVHYTGEDLNEMAEYLGLSVESLIQRHTGALWQVAFCGFAPGFAYLVSREAGLHVPRRASPRTRIPAGSVGLAGEFSGIYPHASPGGWQLIGRTEETLFSLDRQPPALLQPGMQVQFIDAARSCVSVPVVKPQPMQQPASGSAVMAVLSPGLQTLYQDAGRAGQASMGISPSGALDQAAWRRANWLVGNPGHLPALEITAGGFSANILAPMVVALAGAPCPVMVTRADGQRYTASPETPLALETGDQLRLGSPATGVRSYLVRRGGWGIAPQLGSASRDTLAQVGPEPLQAGDTIYAGNTVPQSAVQPATIGLQPLPAPGETITLDIVPGPRCDWFSTEAFTQLTSQCWQVTPQSNRIGLRLQGDLPLARTDNRELPSEGTCTGAIQVPANGQPVLFLADHPLTGGYPVIGAVAHYHLDIAGQLPPGCQIRFRAIRPFTVVEEYEV
ncbi:5-oxoprolinase subunit PxpB [Mangrovibacter yixingensis]|uniref:5-oxoprolinase subunit PxpB n=1 Tax=Mangrovibacter yixingensis TaxID=1529639 RepID=UPI001CFC2E90|nr:5-oxoprolinase subunit PxpB [Mangrovibacter yixingensis]